LKSQAKLPLFKDDVMRGAKAANLTRRESEVCALLADGETYHGVGASLGISPHTVAAYVRSIHSKLKLSSTVAVTSFLLRQSN